MVSLGTEVLIVMSEHAKFACKLIVGSGMNIMTISPFPGECNFMLWFGSTI